MTGFNWYLGMKCESVLCQGLWRDVGCVCVLATVDYGWYGHLSRTSLYVLIVILLLY